MSCAPFLKESLDERVSFLVEVYWRAVTANSWRTALAIVITHTGGPRLARPGAAVTGVLDIMLFSVGNGGQCRIASPQRVLYTRGTTPELLDASGADKQHDRR